MADFKRRTLFLCSGKQIKLFGNSVAIAKSPEIGEGYAPNIFSCINNQIEDKTMSISHKFLSSLSFYNDTINATVILFSRKKI